MSQYDAGSILPDYRGVVVVPTIPVVVLLVLPVLVATARTARTGKIAFDQAT
jgi:hypothetical protein